MDLLEESLTNASNERIIPGAILAATNTSGSFRYCKAFGYSLATKENPSSRPLEGDSILMIASCTKLITSIAALQCVERGLFDLDKDVSSVLPELAALKILTGFTDNGQPVTKDRQSSITLRHLLTHTAGLGYDFMSPKLQRYRESMGQSLPNKAGTVPGRFDCPLLYEPGTSWMYSPAIDFAGLLVERLTGESLEDHMWRNIWQPLGIKDLTFWPKRRPDMVPRMSSLTLRDPDGSGKVIPFSGTYTNEYNTECFGGGGCYGAMPEYLKILHSLLADDEKLLNRKSTANLFSPQLPRAGKTFLNSLRDRPKVWSQFIGEFPREVELDWSLGGMLTVEATPGWRGKHTMVWSGLPNLYWFIDKEKGVCGIFGSQVFPPGDSLTGKYITMFEKTIYQQAHGMRNKL